MDTYDVEVLLDRLAAAMEAREVADKAREAYVYRYHGCDEEWQYERAKERLAETLTLLIPGSGTLNHQSTEW
jgi:hypothetical protein